MEYLGIRLSPAEKKLLKDSAKKAGMSLSDFVRNRLFSQTNDDDFISFRAEQQELNEQIVEALKGIDNRLAFNNSASSLVLRSIPGGMEHFKNLRSHYFPKEG